MKKRRKEVTCLAALFCAAIVGGTASNTVTSVADNMEVKVGDLTITVPDHMLAANVNSFLNVRLEPSSSSTVIAKLMPGDTVEYVEKKGDWTEITINGQVGYVYSKYTVTGTKLKNYITKNLDKFDIDGKQTKVSYQAVYKTKKAARADEANYSISGKASKNATIYATKSDSKTIANEFEKVEKAYVNVNGLRFRGKPSETSSILSVFSKGTTLDIVSKKNPKWMKVKFNGKTGYISKDYVKIVKVKAQKSNKLGEVKKGEKVVVSALSPNWAQISMDDGMGYVKRTNVTAEVKKEKGSKDVVGFLTNNKSYSVQDIQNDVLLVKLADGGQGYTKANTVKASVDYSEIKVDQAAIDAYAKKAETVVLKTSKNLSKKRKEIVDYAVQFVGNRYVWGGNSLTTGVDCSGFTQQVFKKFGVNLSRCSYEQANNGKQIEFKNLKAGDLVFYYDTAKKRIGHVALYIGDNKIVHAQSSKTGIVISKWNYRTPYKAVNVLGD